VCFPFVASVLSRLSLVNCVEIWMQIASDVRDCNLRLGFPAFERMLLGSNKCTWQMAAAKEWEASEKSVKDLGHESILFRTSIIPSKSTRQNELQNDSVAK
jgi:hypothetical protein